MTIQMTMLPCILRHKRRDFRHEPVSTVGTPAIDRNTMFRFLRLAVFFSLLSWCFSCGVAWGQGDFEKVGGTWDFVRPSTPSTAPFSAVYFFNQSKGWMADTEGVILHTRDGGTHWRRAQTPAAYAGATWHDISFISETEGWAVGTYAVPEAGGKAAVVHTTNGGLTWEAGTPDGGTLSGGEWTYSALTSLHFNGAYGALSGRGGILFLTSDSGATWELVDIGMEADIGEAYVYSEAVVWVASLDGVYVSEDFGVTWTSSVTGAFMGIDFRERFSTIWACGDRALAFSTDNGVSWERIELPNNVSSPLKDVLIMSDAVWLVERDSGNLWINQNIGIFTWTRAAEDLGDNFLNVHAIDNLMIWLVGGERTGERVNHVFSTYDGGRTWNSLKNIDTEPLYSVYGMGETMWAGGAGGVWKTTDHGLSWTRHSVGSALLPLRGLHFANENRGWAASADGSLYTSEDGGANWSVQKRDRGDSFTSLYFHNEQKGWAAGTGGIAAQVCRTTDGGANWDCLPVGKTGTLHDVVFVNGEEGWAVGGSPSQGGFVFSTTDGGMTWEENTAIGSLSPHILHDLHIDGARLWVAGTIIERGVEEGALFTSGNRGVSWRRAAGSLLDAPPLNAVVFSGIEGWVVGDTGTCHHTEDGGITWTVCADNFISLDLNDLYTPADAEGTSWLVGAGATIMRNRGVFLDFIAPTGTALETDGGSKTFEVSSNLSDWMLSSSEPWATLAPSAGGSGRTTITLNYSALSGSGSRSVTITAISSSGLTESIIFSQAGREIHLTPAANQEGVYVLDPVGGVLSLTVLSAAPWTFSYHADWIIDITPKEGMGVGIVSVRYEANEGNASRQATISVQTNAGFPIEYTATQDTIQFAVGELPLEITVSRNAGNYVFSVPASGSWSIREEPITTWLAVSQFGDKKAYASISYQALSGNRERRHNVLMNVGDRRHNITVIQSTTELILQPKSRKLTAAAGRYPFVVQCPQAWTLSVEPESPWITSVSPSSGVSTEIVYIDYTENNTEHERIAFLRAESEGAVQTLLLTHLPASIGWEYKGEALADEEIIRVGSVPGTFTLKLSAEKDWNLSKEPDVTWLTIDPTSGTSDTDIPVVVSYQGNPTAYTRGANILAKVGNNRKRFTLFQKDSTQSIATPIFAEIVIEEELVASEAGEILAEISANDNWTLTTNVPWLTLGTTSGQAGNHAINIRYSENDTLHLRTANVILIVDNVRRSSVINQSARGSSFLEIYLSEAVVDYRPGTVTLNIESLGKWIVFHTAEWTTIEPKGGANDGSAVISYTENFGEQERRSTITAANDFFKKEVVLIQRPKSDASFDQYFGSYAENTFRVRVYPNPAFDRLFVDYDGADDWCAFLMDVSGKTHLSHCNTRKERKSLPMAGLPEGLYLLKLTTSNGEYTQKILKRNAP